MSSRVPFSSYAALFILLLMGFSTAAAQQPFARLAPSSACQEPYDGTHTGESDLAPPDTADSRFIADQSDQYDQFHGMWDNLEEITFCIETTRFMGEIDQDKFLEDADQLIADGLLAEKLRLMVRGVFIISDHTGQLNDGFLDVDAYLHKGQAGEVDLGEVEGMYSGIGPDDGSLPPEWQVYEIEVDVRALKFPADPGLNGQIQPEANELTFDLSGHYIDHVVIVSPEVDSIYVHVDWMALEPKDGNDLGWRPVMLLHGWTSNAGIWSQGDAEWKTELMARHVSYEIPQLAPVGNIVDNGKMVTDQLAKMKERFGVNRLHIVGHSKGGLDAREHAQANADDVQTLMMIGTPNEGSPMAELLLDPGTQVPVNNYIRRNYNPFQLTPSFLEAYNQAYQPGSEVSYVAGAGEFIPAGLGILAVLLGGLNDTVVSVESALALNVGFVDYSWFYASADQYTVHSTFRDNANTFTDYFDGYIAVRPLIESATLQDNPTAGPPILAQASQGHAYAPPRTWRNAGTPRQLAAATQAQLVGRGANFATASSTLQDSVEIGTVSRAVFVMHSEIDQPLLGLELVDPLGNRIDAATTDPGITYYPEAPGARFKTIGFDINQPLPGKWYLDAVGQSGVLYVWGVYEEGALSPGGSFVTLTAATDAAFYHNGDPITLTATLDDGGTPVTGATVEANVVLPDSSTSTLILFDDGTNGDPVPNDGQYTNAFTSTTQVGGYAIGITAEQTSPLSFSRHASTTASVAASSTVFSGVSSDTATDTDGDGLLNQLTIDLELNVDVAGTYHVYGTLADNTPSAHGKTQGAAIEPAHAEVTLAPGLHNVSLRFDGAAIRQHGVNGPYLLENVMLKEADTGAVVDFLTLGHTTGAYTHSDFERSALLRTGVTNEYGWDLFGDPSFDFLVVEVEVDALLSGAYHWSAGLYAPDGSFVAAAASQGTRAIGAANIDFLFTAADIVAAGMDGPYELKLLSMAGRDLSTTGAAAKSVAMGLTASLLETGVVVTTQAYTLEDFGGDAALKLNLNVFLAGAYNAGVMETQLNAAGLVPTNQPYQAAPWNYAGTEQANPLPGDVVDWVLVRLLTGDPLNPPMTIQATAAGLLRSDGTITATGGLEPVRFEGPAAGDYYVGVIHRNHLMVMSAAPVALSPGAAAAYTFTDAMTKAYGTNPLIDLGDGNFALWGGDGDANDLVTAFDFLNTWLPINGASTLYTGGDFNLDGNGSAFDFLTVWLPANGQASQVPN